MTVWQPPSPQTRLRRYDRQNIFRAMVDCQFIAAMGPPGGGRNFITPRYARHYNHVAICDVDDRSMQRIFTRIMDWALTKVPTPLHHTVIHSLLEYLGIN